MGKEGFDIEVELMIYFDHFRKWGILTSIHPKLGYGSSIGIKILEVVGHALKKAKTQHIISLLEEAIDNDEEFLNKCQPYHYKVILNSKMSEKRMVNAIQELYINTIAHLQKFN